ERREICGIRGCAGYEIDFALNGAAALFERVDLGLRARVVPVLQHVVDDADDLSAHRFLWPAGKGSARDGAGRDILAHEFLVDENPERGRRAVGVREPAAFAQPETERFGVAAR